MQRKYSSVTCTTEPAEVELRSERKKRGKQYTNPKDRTAIIIGWILQGGVILSATIIAVGVVLQLVHPGGLTGQVLPTFPHTLAQVGTGLLTLHSQAVISLGLLLLIATPVLRVAASVVTFAL